MGAWFGYPGALVQAMTSDINFHHERSRLDAAQLARWQGLPLAWLDVAGAVRNRIVNDVPVLALIDVGTADAEIACGGRTARLAARPGSIGLFDAGESRVSSWRCRTARRIMVKVDLPWLVARGLGASDWQGLRLRRDLEFRDPALCGLLRMMVREVAEGCPSGPLAAESLSLGLAMRVVASHGELAPPRRERGRLTAAQQRRVDELIDAELGGPLPLARLAGAAGYSAPHFTRLFRLTVGCTPHQYVLRKRASLAQSLLTGTDAPLADIALRAGFATQSHMTHVLVRQLGATPGAVRARRLG